MTGEVAADIIRETLYAGKRVADLTQAEKENISALAQLVSGLAVAAGTGGDVSDIGTAVAGSKNAIENNFLDSTGHLQAGVVDYAGTAQEVIKELQFNCGNNCTEKDYEEAFKAAGLMNRFEEFTYMIPWASLVYGGFDSIKEGDITPLLQAGISQTEIGGIIMMLYRNQPNAPTESEVLLRLENLAYKGQNTSVKDISNNGSQSNSSSLTYFPKDPTDLNKVWR